MTTGVTLTRRGALAALAALPLLPRPGLAQPRWAPERPIRLLVGFAPGGGTDISARTLAQKLQGELGQPLVVENRPGAGGNIATEQLVRAAPDGQTLMLGTIAALTVNPSLFRNLPFDPLRDVAPISLSGNLLNILVTSAEKSYRSLAALIAAARRAPDSVTYGSSGVGTTGHLAGALLDQMAGIATVHVPYRGGGPLLTDLLSGKVDYSFATAPTALPHVQAGRLIALGTPGLARSALLPEVPAVAETLPGYEVPNWNALVGPRGLPAPVVSRLNEAMRAAIADAEVRRHLLGHGIEPVHSSPGELARFMAEQTAKWRALIRAAGITAD